jgi:cysteine desulfurase family protein
MKKIYADNSSTSFPKAPGVSEAIKDFLDKGAYNINRGSYSDSYDVALEVLETRQMLADMFHARSPKEIVFTPSVTYSLNMLLQGFLEKGDHIITTSMEHNAIMRPLHKLSKEGIFYDTVPCDKKGFLDVERIIPFIRKETKAVVMLHGSNVCGTLMPIYKVSEICKEYNLKLIVDVAQTAGTLDIDTTSIDALVFAGHKGLLAPQGIGGFVIKEDFADKIKPLIVGGTGSISHELKQPNMLPDKFESGTINIPGIIGLKRALEYINQIGIKEIHKKEIALTSKFISLIENINDVNIIGMNNIANRIAVISLDFPKHDNGQITAMLDEKHGIMTRCGLHCAPNAHKTLGTYPQGTVRFSFGYFNTVNEVEYIVEALKEILID